MRQQKGFYYCWCQNQRFCQAVQRKLVKSFWRNRVLAFLGHSFPLDWKWNRLSLLRSSKFTFTLTSGYELLQRLCHDSFFGFAIAIEDLVGFTIVHFKDCDEVVGITRLDGFRPSQTGTKIGAEMKQIFLKLVCTKRVITLNEPQGHLFSHLLPPVRDIAQASTRLYLVAF